MAQLRAYKDNGVILFDTNLICYGLIKSGYMSYLQTWTRRLLRSAQLDPSEGSNFSPVVVSTTFDQGDNLWGFTVYNVTSPITFITGSGCLVGTQISGNSTTFFYTNASTSTKFYCFDLMANNIAGSPYLKTYDTSGRITFNSLQPPLNVIGSVQAPGPPAVDRFGRYPVVYNGASLIRRRSSYNWAGVESVIDISLGATEYAAFLPWSRSAQCIDTAPNSPTSGPITVYGSSEGAYGRYGGMSFIMGATAGSSQVTPGGNQYTVPASWQNLPLDRLPTALLIYTNNYPFPYN
jgi:hypothetical protein